MDNHGKHSKILKKLIIRCYSCQIKKQFCRMNGLRVLKVIVSAKRSARVVCFRHSFFSDGSLSKH